MPTPVTRDEVQRLLVQESAQLVEVLPTQEYEDEHIADAINIPLKRLDRKSTGGLNKHQPIIVY